MNIMGTRKILIGGIVVGILLIIGLFQMRFEYRECLKVGHSHLYCIFQSCR